MNYQCQNPACELKGEVISDKVAKRRNHMCEACGRSLVSTVDPKPESGHEPDAWSAKVIATYPVLIAQPLAALATKRDVEAQAKTLVDVFTNALKYLALVVETEYLYSPYQSETVNRILDEDLERPLVSAWNKFLREALPFLSQAGHKPFISELKPFYDAVEAGKPRIKIPGKGYYDDNGNFVATESKLGLISALISYRNNFAHGLNQPEVDARSDCEFYHDLLRKMLEGMAWCTCYPLFKREDGRWIRLMGERPVEADPALRDVPPEASLVLGSPDPGRCLSLVPFLIVPRQFISDTAIGEDVLMYDQTTRKRILYVSPRGHQRETKGTLEHWRMLIENKRIRLPVLTPDTLNADELAARFDRVTRESTQRKDNVLAGAYLSRPAPELELRVWPGTSYPLAALGARAGAGKTCLLEHMVETWSANGHEVLLVSCGRIEHRDFMSLLRERLALAETVDLHTWSGVLWNSGRRWVVVLDGLNEHPYREQFMASVLVAARELGSAGLRIVFSFRTEAMEWLKVSETERRLFVEPSSGDKAGPAAPGAEAGVPHIPVGPLDMVERAAMWRLYAKHDPAKYKPAFGFNDMVSESRELAGFLSNPLLLRLFLQVYHNRAIPDRLSRSAFMTEYLHSIFKESGDKGHFLLELGRVLWERKAIRMTVDELFDVPMLADAVRSDDVNSPYRKLTSARLGVLVEWREENDRHVMFCAEAVMEALLGVVLDQANPRPTELVVLLAEHAEYPPARRAVTEALRQAVERGGTAVLAQFIQQEGADIADVSGAVVADLLLSGRDPAALAGALAEVIPPSSMSALCRAAFEAGAHLWSEYAYDIGAKFSEALARDVVVVTEDGHLLARLFWRAGRSLCLIGNHKDALVFLLRAVTLERKALGEDHPDVAMSLNDIAVIYGELGNYSQQLEHALRALDMNRKVLGGQHREVARCLSIIGSAYGGLGQYAKALEYKMHAMEVRLKVLGEEATDVADALNGVGNAYGNLGEYAKAKDYYARALDLQRKLLGEENREVACSLYNVGHAWGWLGDHGKALELQLRALEMEQKCLREAHPNLVSTVLGIGCTYRELGDYSQALAYEQRALEMGRKVFGEGHPIVASTMNAIGLTYGKMGDHAKASEIQLRALAMFRNCVGGEHPDMASILDNLGCTQGRMGEHAKALDSMLRAMEIRTISLGAEHPDTAKSLCHIGSAYDDQGDHSKALEYHLRALAVRQKALGEEHPEVATSLNSIGLAYGHLGEHAKELEFELRALQMEQKLLGEEHPSVAAVLSNIGLTYGEMGQHTKALEYHLRTLAVRQKVLGEAHPDVATTLNNIGTTYGEMGQHTKALEFQLRALVVQQGHLGVYHPDVATTFNNIGVTHRHLGQYVKALECHLPALELQRKALGPNHPYVATSLRNIALTYGDSADHLKALEYHLLDLALRQKAQEQHRPGIARSMVSIGATYRTLEDYTKALEYHLRALEVRLDALGAEHPDVVTSLCWVGNAYSDVGNHAKALEFQLRALALQVKLFGEEHADVLTSLSNIASTYCALNAYGKALELELRELDLRKKLQGEENEDVATCLNDIGVTYRNRGQYSKALEYHQRALDMRRRLLGEDHDHVANSLSGIGITIGKSGDHQAALEYKLKALALRRKLHGGDHADVAKSIASVGETYAALGDTAQAEEHKRLAQEMTERLDKPTPGPKREAGRPAANELSHRQEGGTEVNKLFKDASLAIDQERQEAVKADLGKLASQYGIPVDALVGIVTEYVPTLADYNETHTEPAMRNLRQRGFDAKDAMHVLRLTQELRQALTYATQQGGPI